jgi:hypothetical protein
MRHTHTPVRFVWLLYNVCPIRHIQAKDSSYNTYIMYTYAQECLHPARSPPADACSKRSRAQVEVRPFLQAAAAQVSKPQLNRPQRYTLLLQHLQCCFGLL